MAATSRKKMANSAVKRWKSGRTIIKVFKSNRRRKKAKDRKIEWEQKNDQVGEDLLKWI